MQNNLAVLPPDESWVRPVDDLDVFTTFAYHGEELLKKLKFADIIFFENSFRPQAIDNLMARLGIVLIDKHDLKPSYKIVTGEDLMGVLNLGITEDPESASIDVIERRLNMAEAVFVRPEVPLEAVIDMSIRNFSEPPKSPKLQIIPAELSEDKIPSEKIEQAIESVREKLKQALSYIETRPEMVRLRRYAEAALAKIDSANVPRAKVLVDGFTVLTAVASLVVNPISHQSVSTDTAPIQAGKPVVSVVPTTPLPIESAMSPAEVALNQAAAAVDLEFDTNHYGDLERYSKITPSNRSVLNQKPGEFLNPDAPEVQMEGLVILGNVSRNGVTVPGTNKVEHMKAKMFRSLRFKNITDAVEARYQLPPGMILAMIMEESGGADLLPNGVDDGGAGLCHMQGAVAKGMGLDISRTYTSGMRDKRHGRELRETIERLRYDIRELAEYDDRFNRIQNIDTVGRILAKHINGKKINRNGFRNIGWLQTAIARYSGTVNYKGKYLPDLVKNMSALYDPEVIAGLEADFNAKNTGLTINGVKPKNPFKAYLAATQAENESLYELDKYRELGGIKYDRSAGILSSYKDFLVK